MRLSTIYVSEDDASERCISPGWYLTSNGFTHLGDGMVVPFETQAEALAYIESLTES